MTARPYFLYVAHNLSLVVGDNETLSALLLGAVARTRRRLRGGLWFAVFLECLEDQGRSMLQTARFIHTGWQADSYREFISWLSSEGACSDDGICALLLRIAVAGDA